MNQQTIFAALAALTAAGCGATPPAQPKAPDASPAGAPTPVHTGAASCGGKSAADAKPAASPPVDAKPVTAPAVDAKPVGAASCGAKPDATPAGTDNDPKKKKSGAASCGARCGAKQ